MTTATIKGFIHANTSSYGAPFQFFMNEDLTELGFVNVMPFSFDVEIPDDFNPIAAKLSALEAMKEKIRREFEQRVMHINEEISKLQCLEFDPKVSA